MWQFKVMPFGLCNFPATFKCLMWVLADRAAALCICMTSSPMPQTYREPCPTWGTSFKPAAKQVCVFTPKNNTFFGRWHLSWVISSVRSGCSQTQQRRPQWGTGPCLIMLRSCVLSWALASYYRQFVKCFATIASPLHWLTQKGQAFQLDKECASAFMQLRSTILRAPVLAYTDPGWPFIVDTDASRVGFGTVLSQGGEHGEQVMAYYSCSLCWPERNYCVTHRE